MYVILNRNLHDVVPALNEGCYKVTCSNSDVYIIHHLINEN